MTDIEVCSIQNETCSQNFNPLKITIYIFSIIIFFKIIKPFNEMQRILFLICKMCLITCIIFNKNII